MIKTSKKTFTGSDATLKVKSQLERWKHQLIDFSKRNQLLYFKYRPSLTINFQDDPKSIHKKLVLENSSLSFKAKVAAFDSSEFGDNDLLPMDPDSVEPGMTFEEAVTGVDDNAVGLDTALDLAGDFLQSDNDAKSLEQVLSKLKTRAKASLQEQGVNILYLALYFLKWTDAKQQNSSEEFYYSPLLLLPVSLERKGLSGDFRLSLIEDEIRINPTLSYKLERDYGIKLGDLELELNQIENQEELESWLEKTSKRITQDQSSWEIKEESCLSLFSFAKLSLYRDIEDNEKQILNHKIVRQIAGEILSDKEQSQELKNLIKVEEIDLKIDANKSKQIVDADSSQEEAIYAARAGLSFVIQGPPGTGKSQTIANIIAESLAQNKKILFVSEKKSALDVVASRLKIASLDKFCLELHNSQQKKSDIVSALKNSVEEVKALAISNSDRQSFSEDINKVKTQINKGIAELHKIRQPINRSLYEIYSELAGLNLKYADYDIDFTIPAIERINLEKFAELDFFFKRLASLERVVCNYSSYIWRNANVNSLSFTVENEIKSNFIEFKNIISRVAEYANPISQEYFGKETKTLKEFKWLAESVQLAMSSPFPKKEWFNSQALGQVQALTIEAKIEHEDYENDKQTILSKYSAGFLSLDHNDLVNKFTQKFNNVFRYFHIDYWKSIGQIKKLALYNESNDLKSVIDDLQQAAQLDLKAQQLNKSGTELDLVLGDFYQEFDTDWNETITAIKWVQKIMNKFDGQVLPGSLVSVISEDKNQDDFSGFESKAQELIKAAELVSYHLKFYRSIFSTPNVDLDNLSLDELSDHLEDLITNIADIEDWIEFRQLQVQAQELGMKQFVESLIATEIDSLDAETIKNIFLRKLYQLWVDKIEIENPEMRKFSGKAQQLLIDKFNGLDQDLLKNNQNLIAKSLAMNWIEFAANNLNKADLQILNHELNKKKKHKPMRILVKEIPELLQTVKPCWMMSPLSVSQLIEANKDKDIRLEFDLVIFDEASQIRTEDAICAIYRGKQLILAGDSNQLPPTNFFNYTADDDDHENSSFESVLDECAVFLDAKTLNWHYRSRHEDLIKFSNYHIYDNQLITFPAPIASSENYGVDFNYVEGGCYEKGSRFNRREAQVVAQAIIDHYLIDINISLGVIAFSEAQQFAIERELAKLLRKDASLQERLGPALDEENLDALFIKNLENVQGDERDVIYFSIGYAYDKQGNLSHNFGPLNREGGHRRLNVAVTRARNKLKVFSSILSNDIDPSRTSSQGAMLLKKYLAFAESSAAGSSLLADVEDEIKVLISSHNDEQRVRTLENSIVSKLESHGYHCEQDLGSSDYRIDIAVRSKEDPSQFVLAIETDGEVYRSAKTTRDRERLRKQALNSLGWQVHRVWARDWIRNQDEELDKILALL